MIVGFCVYALFRALYSANKPKYRQQQQTKNKNSNICPFRRNHSVICRLSFSLFAHLMVSYLFYLIWFGLILFILFHSMRMRMLMRTLWIFMATTHSLFIKPCWKWPKNCIFNQFHRVIWKIYETSRNKYTQN